MERSQAPSRDDVPCCWPASTSVLEAYRLAVRVTLRICTNSSAAVG